eukprot:TRINITY_DN26109_c0_g1_i4.p1 TRINITY_DN26109_c0_g1~~TRINITY_DN26109_c0_g1_i4.p1  ORF type:complete len:621 (+),score=75.45 TRINITY_DN26109_c0_g1_i4:170-2032(+)
MPRVEHVFKAQDAPSVPGGHHDGFSATFWIATCGALGGVSLAAWGYSYSSDDANDRVWAGHRGPLSTQRALALGPILACFGSGCVAATISYCFPSRVYYLAMSSKVHDLLVLPLSILLAFRFQGSYDRWWSARTSVEDVASKAVTICLLGAARKDPHEDEDNHIRAKNNLVRLLDSVDALCFFMEHDMMAGNDPHTKNKPVRWCSPSFADADDVEASRIAHDPTLWCFDVVTECIYRSQDLDTITPEMSSTLLETVASMKDQYRQCMTIVRQDSPAPFIVHVRTLLGAFCFTYPFTILDVVPPLLLVPMQVCVSFSLLGIDFCAREMEYPFGDDEDDVPCRQIFSDARVSIEQIRAEHGKNCLDRRSEAEGLLDTLAYAREEMTDVLKIDEVGDQFSLDTLYSDADFTEEEDHPHAEWLNAPELLVREELPVSIVLSSAGSTDVASPPAAPAAAPSTAVSKPQTPEILLRTKEETPEITLRKKEETPEILLRESEIDWRSLLRKKAKSEEITEDSPPLSASSRAALLVEVKPPTTSPDNHQLASAPVESTGAAIVEAAAAGPRECTDEASCGIQKASVYPQDLPAPDGEKDAGIRLQRLVTVAVCCAIAVRLVVRPLFGS